MNNTFTLFLYIITIILVIISYIKDKGKTKLAFKKSWEMFISVLPQFLGILLLVSLLLSFTSTETIQKIIGEQAGLKGMIIASLIGSVSLIPVLVAFPIASELINNGAGIMQIAVFISTLTTVGFVTLPIERKFLGNKIAYLRNILFFLSAFLVAFGVGVCLR